MRTNVLAYLIGVVGLTIIVAGAWGLLVLLTGHMPRVPLRYYAMALGMVAGGLSMIGVAQALRLLTVIYFRAREESIRTYR
jgi:hypothetical protein